MQKSLQHDLSQQQHLIEEMREDLRVGFTQVVEVYQAHLERVAAEVVADTPRLAHQVEDIVQDGLLTAFVRLKAHPEILSHHLKLQAWLCGLIAQQARASLEMEEQQFVVTAGLRGEELADNVEQGKRFPLRPSHVHFERRERVREAQHLTQWVLIRLPLDQHLARERSGSERKRVQS